MIRNLLFVPCEQVLVGDGGTTSLISILENLELTGEIVKSLPENAAVPRSWSGLALWTRTAKVQRPTTYICRIDLYDTIGVKIAGGDVEFVVSNKFANYRNTVNFNMLPIGRAGVLKLKLSYKLKSGSKFKPVTEFPITITHKKAEDTAKKTGTAK